MYTSSEVAFRIDGLLALQGHRLVQLTHKDGNQLLTKLARRALFDLLSLQGAHLGSGGGIWAKDG